MHSICQEQFCHAQACIPLFMMSIKFIAQNEERGEGMMIHLKFIVVQKIYDTNWLIKLLNQRYNA